MSIIFEKLFLLYILLIDHNINYISQIFPAFWVLTNSKSQAMYTAIWLRVLELAPQLRNNNFSVLGDYEAAPLAAIHDLFQGVTLRGCWFHYNQALLRKWKRLSLHQAPRDILWMGMSLALLPSQFFEAGIACMQASADLIAADYPRILEFMAYMRLQWLPRANIVSAYRCPIRTNNQLEAFNRQLPERISGPRRNVLTNNTLLTHKDHFIFYFQKFITDLS